ncbi:uncharacterized protein LOC131237166 isoform X2 [Magnolia sinica]|uniref:uncharacterized protein LOC131237166 isoform X2 n=1 Tax=Magnolia sinica TaxID=86752 RepID=UPI00265A8F55|nr:uncharacterized protein LOC131237166 isoform X2 [Magnolia sinica]
MEEGEHPQRLSTHMTTISSHSFGQSCQTGDDEDGLTIHIIENMQEDYGMFVWPCSIVLAEYVWQQRPRFLGMTVVELGAGTSLPGLVAAKVGSDVVLTDNSNRLEVLENMRKTSDLNNLNCKILGLTWGEWDAPLFSLNPKILLGADVLYDTNDSVFITTYHNRSGHHLIEYLMVKWGLKCTKLVDAFSFMPSLKASTLRGNIQLVEMTLGHH